MDEYKGIADFLHQRMKAERLSTYDIARLSGNRINANTITRILNRNVHEIKLSTLEAIAVAFKAPIEDIVRVAFGRDENPQWMQVYAERLDGEGLEPNEWQFLEQIFRDQVQRYKAFRNGPYKNQKKTPTSASKRKTLKKR
jgi:transcriptional regulator with XRE-family HTH domain